jgi:hypothetical protein
MPRNTHRLVSALAVLGLVVLAGCSDDDGDVATVPPTTIGSAATTVATATSAATGTSNCANQIFTPNSEDIAGAVVATGLSCADAEAFLRKVGPLVGATGGPASITVDGFDCVRTRQDDGTYGIPSADYECTRGPMEVTFTRT